MKKEQLTPAMREMVEEFRKEYLEKGSECTWKLTPPPIMIQDSLIEAMHKVREEAIEEMKQKYEEDTTRRA